MTNNSPMDVKYHWSFVDSELRIEKIVMLNGTLLRNGCLANIFGSCLQSCCNGFVNRLYTKAIQPSWVALDKIKN